MEQPAALCGVSLWLAPLGFPRGCCRAQRIFQNHDCQWQSFQNQKAAERSEADEGWRWLKVIDCLVKWWKLKHIPFIGLHSFTMLSPPLIRLFCQSVPKCRLSKNPASPRGSQELRRLWCTPFNKPLCCVGFGSPNWRPLQWLCKIMGLYNLYSTPPQSARSGCQLPQRWSQGCFAPGNGEAKGALPLRVTKGD